MQSFFVSSTFKDMQGERDALHRIVMPRLQEKARSSGETVQFVDLRWGISTTDLDSDAGAEKILGVCLDEIRNCKPYMIILLGERYGWMPPPALLQQTAEKKRFQTDSYEMSVTELEIRYGMWLASDKLEQCIFCLRDPMPADALTQEEKNIYLSGSEDDKRRMDALRQKIISTPGINVLHYSLQKNTDGALTGYDTFAEQLCTRLEDLLAPQWAANNMLTWHQRHQKDEHLVMEQHLTGFVGREKELDHLQQLIRSHTVTVLEGEGGCGKSAMMAQLCWRETELHDLGVMFSCGINSYCTNVSQLMRLALWNLAEHGKNAASDVPDTLSDSELRQLYNSAMAEYDGREMVLFIDAIDQLAAEPALYESWFIPPVISPRLRFVVSTTGAVRLNPLALPGDKGGAGVVMYKVQPPEEADLRQILAVRFEAEHKQVSDTVADKILQNPCSKNMLGMEIIVRRLVMLNKNDFDAIARLEQTMSGSEAIDTYLCQIVEGLSSQLNQLIINYFEDVFAFLTEGGDIVTVQLPLYIIAVMRHGFSTGQLEQMQEFIRTNDIFHNVPQDSVWRRFWDPIHFARLQLYLGPLLCRRANGSIDFTHRLLRQALCSRMGAGNISYMSQWFLNQCPAGDNDRLENMLPFTRMYLDFMKDSGNTEPINRDYVDYCFHWVIRDAGILEEDDDPVRSAEGSRQLRILERSVLDDMEGEEGFAHVRAYCRILDDAIQNGAGVNHFTVWFFGVRISGLLKWRGDAGKAKAICILCRILASLHTQRQKLADGEEKYAQNWTKPFNRFQLYHSRALWLYGELSGSFHRHLIKLEKYYGYGPEEIFEKGCALADELIAANPDNYSFYIRKADLHIDFAQWMKRSEFGFRTSKRVKYVQSGMQYAKQSVEVAERSGDASGIRTSLNRLLEDAAEGCNVMLAVYTQQILGKMKVLQQAIQMCEEANAIVCKHTNLLDLSVRYAAPFIAAWGECLRNCKVENEKQFADYDQKALDLWGEYYYTVATDNKRQLSEEDRQELARLAVKLAYWIPTGKLPACMKQAGYRPGTAVGLLLEKESGYLQAQVGSDFESRWHWAVMLKAEIYYHSGARPAQCAAACERALQLLPQLEKEASEYGKAMSFSENQIIRNRKYAQRLLQKSRETLAANT